MADEGATPRELLLEACRRDNVELLAEVLKALSVKQINDARDGIGNYCLHVAASYGSYDVLDQLLDQDGLEVDPVDRLDGDTPLHKAVRYANSEWDAGKAIVELLLDAGADPRLRNKGKLKALELVDPRNKDLRTTLQKAEFAQMAGNDIVDEEDDDDDPDGASESD